MGEKHSEQADEFYFILTVGSDSLFSSLARALHLSQRHLFFFFCFFPTVMETIFGDRTYHAIASLSMKLALRAAEVFYGHLTMRHNIVFL